MREAQGRRRGVSSKHIGKKDIVYDQYRYKNLGDGAVAARKGAEDGWEGGGNVKGEP